ncbi:hypothetical protein METBIDRAFT_30722 [Metschnikowia bicuspidata var. bicuspidata NRRL YB-4993]|uniref:Translation initiation factor eIF2B subunit gamma n=1 Tax=Metschnikowia bicuspidata var. bicuspidata NRRL YB-4993 TaxID=869754 RepID=A0A1A0HKN4_9ASCO|nr:hypothetical protein METBIDRAFT_30722 [Metschnikowia bicuspidata var. bicuspidata NRRL YB-4993]OBA24452.1 hypothetical protein METBIDRAFT_30722 [Metschnikowia bicuspidata var. bicuspidata NRRL YB-4993]
MEFHAVILCGPGKQLAPFSQQRATGAPKALLPVGQRPMFEHVLDWCEKAFFPKVTLLCDAAAGAAVRDAVARYKAARAAAVALAPDVLDVASDVLRFLRGIDVAEHGAAASGQALQYVAQHAAPGPLAHFVVLPCDLVTDLPPHVLIEAYRCRRAADLGMLVCYRPRPGPEDKKHRAGPRSYTVYSGLPCGGRAQLLDYYSAADVAFHKGVAVRTQMLWRHATPAVSTRLANGAVFFGDARVLAARLRSVPAKFGDAYFALRPLIKVVRDLARREWQSPGWGLSVGLVEVPRQAVFLRANTLAGYMEATRHLLQRHARDTAGAKDRPAGAKDKAAAAVGADSMVGAASRLGDKTNVKRSVVGAHCTIGKRVRVTGSVVLDGAVVEDDVLLENTIVGRAATVRSRSRLTNCYVEATHDVPRGTHAKGDTLLCLTLEGLVEAAGDSSSSDDAASASSSDDYDSYDPDDGDNSDGLFGY